MLLRFFPRKSFNGVRLFSYQEVLSNQTPFVKTVFKKLEDYNKEADALNADLLA